MPAELPAALEAPSESNLPVKMIRRPALPGLTGIRFAAAFYVVLGHALPWLENHFALPSPVRIFLVNGYLAVSFFFLLSGFILAYTYEGHFSDLRSCPRFWKARFARVYPVYFFSLVLILPFQISHLDLKAALAVLFMVQAWNPFHPELNGAWNYPAWSLSVEAFFYLSFPFLQIWLAAASRKKLFFVGLAALFLAIFNHTPCQGLQSWDPTALTGFPIPLPIVRFPEFLLGMVIGNSFVRFGSTARRPLLTAFAALSSVFVLAATTGPWVSLVALPFAVLLYCLACSRDLITSFFSSRVMLLLGGASYAVYLLQLPVRDWVRTLLVHSPASLHAFSAPLTPLVLVLFSVGVFLYWEEPLRKIIRRRLDAWL